MIRRYCAGTAFCLVAALLLVACGTSARNDLTGRTTGSRTSSPPATSGAQNLRVSIDLALGAHELLLARTTDAALGVRTPEFSAYGTALHGDDATVADAIVPAGTSQARDSVANSLTKFDIAVLNDATAAYTKNTAAQQQATSDMTTTYVPQMRSALTVATHASASTLSAGLNQQVTDTQAIVAAQAAGDWAGAFQALSTAYAHQLAFGTSLSVAIAHTDPQSYAGNPKARAATLRDTLESQLQMQVYLLGMAESAGAGGRTTEQQSAAAAYATSTTEVGTALNPAGSKLASGISSTLTQAQTAAASLAVATAHHDAGGVTSQHQALTKTFPGGYVTIVHGRLHVGQKQATATSSAFGLALANQASAEGQNQASPQVATTAAAAAARLGKQLGLAVATRYGNDFPTS